MFKTRCESMHQQRSKTVHNIGLRITIPLSVARGNEYKKNKTEIRKIKLSE